MRTANNIQIIAINMTGANATVLLNDLPMSTDIGLVHVRSLRVFHNERFGTTFRQGSKSMPVLVLDDIAKITLDFKDSNEIPVIDGLPAATLCDETDKQRYLCDCWIDFTQSKVNLQVAIAGTPGWLLLGFETFD